MSEREPHINPWAEKLQQATLPDVGPAWTAMEALLDSEMPVREKKDRRRWLLLILLLLLIIGICNCPGRGRLFGDRAWKGGTGQGVDRPRAGGADSGVTGGGAAKGGGSVNGGDSAMSGGLVNGDDSAKGGGLANGGRLVNGGRSVNSGDSVNGGATGNGLANGGNGRTLGGGLADSGKGRSAKGPDQPVLTASSARTNRPGTTRNTPQAFGDVQLNTSGRKVARPGKPSGNRTPAGPTTQDETTQQSVTRDGTGKQPAIQDGLRQKPQDGARKKPAFQDDARKKPVMTDSLQKKPATPDSVRKKPATRDSAQKKPATPDSARRKAVGKDSTRKKPPTPPKEEEDKETEKGFVAAIGFNQFFPVGGQQVSDFNSGGITGTLGDYIPVPVGRYYFSKKLYVQLEVQFNAPQYTKKDLVINPAKPDTLGFGRVQNSTVTIKKLLYFNVPLSVHYAPIDGLSLGAGLQFSRLRNAFGSFDTTITNTILTPVDSVVGKRESTLKGSTVYQNISTNEFRFLIDVNYTYKHFVLGVRYNRALSNFIDVRVGSGNVTQSRNNSLQLYLRYILWDGRKKKQDLSGQVK